MPVTRKQRLQEQPNSKKKATRAKDKSTRNIDKVYITPQVHSYVESERLDPTNEPEVVGKRQRWSRQNESGPAYDNEEVEGPPPKKPRAKSSRNVKILKNTSPNHPDTQLLSELQCAAGNRLVGSSRKEHKDRGLDVLLLKKVQQVSGSQTLVESLFPPHSPHPRTDAEYARRFHDLRASAWALCLLTLPSKLTFDLLNLGNESPEIVSYINMITALGAGDTWDEQLQNNRVKITYSVLGKVLEMHVFGHEMFGASEPQAEALRRGDADALESDGFSRQSARAARINAYLRRSPHALPVNFLSSLQTLHARVRSLLEPLFGPRPAARSTTTSSRSFPDPATASLMTRRRFEEEPLSTPLFSILLHAAKLALDMRREEGTVYYLTPSFGKGELHHPELARVYSYSARSIEEEKKEAAKGSVVTIKMSGWGACVAYRKGIWVETGDNDDDEGGRKGRDRPVVDEQGGEKDKGARGGSHGCVIDPSKGVRTRIVAKAEVFCTWEKGMPRFPTLREEIMRRREAGG
ncbi:MAG: hypothetical protein Q9214_004956 [Letrouitia sp. 1 TL-2023]